jgi:hypothetical protein
MTSTDADTPIRGGFIRVDPVTGAIAQIIPFQTDPATVSRALASTPTNGNMSEPREQITFTLALEATAPATNRLGVYPMLSALELLMYVPAGPAPLIVFVWGNRRILPVRVTELQVKEQQFDGALTPIQAELAVTVQVLKTADLAEGSEGRRLWDAHVKVLQSLASDLPPATLADLGLGGLGGTTTP